MSGFEPLAFKNLKCCVRRSNGRPCGRPAVKVLESNFDAFPVCESHRLGQTFAYPAVKKMPKGYHLRILQNGNNPVYLYRECPVTQEVFRYLQRDEEEMEGLRMRVRRLEALLGEKKAVPGVKEDFELTDWSVVKKESGPAYGEE